MPTLTFFSASLCSTLVRTTGYPCPPKPYTPHLHINLLFNIILCHSRPICHSASKPPPSQNYLHISSLPLPLPCFPLSCCPLSLRGVLFFLNSSFTVSENIPLSDNPYPIFFLLFPSIYLHPKGPLLTFFMLFFDRNMDTRSWKEGWRGSWRKRVLTGKNAQWGSKPAYQLTSNQIGGKSEGRRGGSHRNRNLKVNVREVGRKTVGGGCVLQQ